MAIEMPTGRITLVFHECFINASVVELPYGEKTLSVYVSPVTDRAGPLYQPVVDYLAAVCSRRKSSVVVEDEGMMFGSAELTTYHVYDECPGDIEHMCAR